jgi:hypothetical protein
MATWTWRRVRPGSEATGPLPDRPARSLLSRWVITAAATTLGVTAAVVAVDPAAAADNPDQRGPDPTAASVAASRGTFATAQVTVAPGNGFNGGMIYYPTDTSRGTFGAIAIMPGYTARFADEEAWMGPWMASFGFVVIGVDTNSPTDFDTARGSQLLAALDYLTQKSPVRDRVDPARLSVVGHSMGGGGALVAALQRPSLKTAVGLAPFKPSGNPTTDQVPTLLIAGQSDTTVTPSTVQTLYNAIPASTEKAYLEFSGAGHAFFTRSNTLEMRILIPWFKIFVDQDARYQQFLCPLQDTSGIPVSRSTCPLLPTGTTTTTTSSTSATTTTTTGRSTTTTTSATTSTTTSTTGRTTTTTTGGGTAACSASFSAAQQWAGGFIGEVRVTAGQALTGWRVTMALPDGVELVNIWNAAAGGTRGTVPAVSMPYNGTLGAGQSTTFGFQGNGTPAGISVSCATG